MLKNSDGRMFIKGPGPALGLGYLGHRLGPPTRGRPPNFRAKIDILKKNGDRGKKIVLHFSSTFKKSQRIE